MDLIDAFLARSSRDVIDLYYVGVILGKVT